jgi:predicted DNA-binding protein
MSTKTTTIRFNDEEQKLLDLYMEFQDQPLSTIIKESLFEDIADFFDSSLSQNALEFNKQIQSAILLKSCLMSWD